MIRSEMLRSKRQSQRKMSMSNIENINKAKPKLRAQINHSRKFNEALSMRSKLSLEKMAQMMIDESKFYRGPVDEIGSVLERTRASKLWLDFKGKDQEFREYEQRILLQAQKQNKASSRRTEPDNKHAGRTNKYFEYTNVVSNDMPLNKLYRNMSKQTDEIKKLQALERVQSELLTEPANWHSPSPAPVEGYSSPESQPTPCETVTVKPEHHESDMVEVIRPKIEQAQNVTSSTRKHRPCAPIHVEKSARKMNTSRQQARTTRANDMFCSWDMEQGNKDGAEDLLSCALVNARPNSPTKHSMSSQMLQSRQYCKSRREPSASASIDGCNLASRAFNRFERWTSDGVEFEDGEYDEYNNTDGGRGDEMDRYVLPSVSRSDTALISKVAMDNADGAGEGDIRPYTSYSELSCTPHTRMSRKTPDLYNDMNYDNEDSECTNLSIKAKSVNSCRISELRCVSGCSIDSSSAETYHSVLLKVNASSSTQLTNVPSENLEAYNSDDENDEMFRMPACPAVSRECNATPSSNASEGQLLVNTYSKNTGGGDDDPKGYYARILRRYADPVVPPPFPYPKRPTPTRDDTNKYINKIMGDAQKRYAQQRLKLSNLREANQVAFYKNRNEKLARQYQISRPSYNLRKNSTSSPVSFLEKNKQTAAAIKAKKDQMEERGVLRLPVIQCAFKKTD